MTNEVRDRIEEVAAKINGTYMAADMLGTIDMEFLKETLKSCYDELSDVLSAQECDASKAK